MPGAVCCSVLLGTRLLRRALPAPSLLLFILSASNPLVPADEAYHSLFKPVMTKIMEVYQPEAVVLQCGECACIG